MNTVFRLTLDRPALPARELAVAPDRALLPQLLYAGVDLPLACRNGNCGRCHAKLLRGLASHTSGDSVALCLSHAESDLHLVLPPAAQWQHYACQALSDSNDQVQLRLPAGKVSLQNARFGLLTHRAATTATLLDQHERTVTFQLPAEAFAVRRGDVVHLLCVKAETDGRHRLFFRQQLLMDGLTAALVREIRESLLQSTHETGTDA